MVALEQVLVAQAYQEIAEWPRGPQLSGQGQTFLVEPVRSLVVAPVGRGVGEATEGPRDAAPVSGFPMNYQALFDQRRRPFVLAPEPRRFPQHMLRIRRDCASDSSFAAQLEDLLGGCLHPI